MSKLVDLLEKIDQVEPEPMGFSAVAGRDRRKAPIVLIGRVEPGRLAKSSKLADADVDAIVVWLDDLKERSVDKVAKSLEGRLWGVRARDVSQESAKHLKEKGCDFIVFDGEATEAAVLNDKDLGKIVEVSPDLSEEMARAIHDMPFDVALFTPAGDLLPLTIGKMMSIHQVRGMIAKPFVMAAPTELGASELEVIRNAGIAGLLLDDYSAEDIDRIRGAAASLPRRRSRPDHDALVPQMHASGFPEQGAEEEEEEEDF